MMVSQEPEWHRMIAEAAYYLAQKRGFCGEHSLEDWLAAEQQVRQVISPILDSEVTMTGTIRQNQPNQPESTELVSVDDSIDAIAREALQEARRVEEAERYRRNPGPVLPPQKTTIVP
jgi:hypothetical protein